ncbi:MAG: ATP-grasp domain-containing protein [Planctomycetes bacterium]|nr:ATP-grasp domain-containing protein [Planctomycetota bacterium]
MAKPTVLVLYNLPLLPKGHPDSDQETTLSFVVTEVKNTLTQAGYSVGELAIGPEPTQLWAELKQRRPGVVVNLFEGSLDQPESESYVAGILEWSGVPFTGSPAPALSLARAKHTAKTLLRGADLPTADFFVVDALPAPKCSLAYPVIVKPALQDGSVGMDHASVCVNARQFRERVQYLLTTYGPPVIVEEYIDGREFNVALVDLKDMREFLLSEIALPDARPGVWPIITYTGKWEPARFEKDWAPWYPKDLARATVRRIEQFAWKAFRLLGCRDYGRVDFRMNSAGELFVIEVNPNPEVSEAAGFSNYLDESLFSYDDFLVNLIENARARQNAPRPTFAPRPHPR